MKSEEYRRAFDNLRFPAGMAERIRRAAADASPEQKREAARRRPGSGVRRGLAACACAAALAVLVWQTGLLPRRGELASGACLDSGVHVSGDTGEASASSGKTGETPKKSAAGTPGKSGGERRVGSDAGSSGKEPRRSGTCAPAKKAPSRVTSAPPPDRDSDALYPERSESVAPGQNTPSGNPVRTVDSPAELAALLNFTPVLPAAVPEGWQIRSCAAVGAKLAQIVYARDGGEVCWRTAPGTGDISGVADGEATDAGNGITFRGTAGTVSAAWWTADGMAFSLTFSPAVSAEEALSWAAAVRG